MYTQKETYENDPCTLPHRRDDIYTKRDLYPRKETYESDYYTLQHTQDEFRARTLPRPAHIRIPLFYKRGLIYRSLFMYASNLHLIDVSYLSSTRCSNFAEACIELCCVTCRMELAMSLMPLSPQYLRRYASIVEHTESTMAVPSRMSCAFCCSFSTWCTYVYMHT